MNAICGKCGAVDHGLPAIRDEEVSCSKCRRKIEGSEFAWDCHACGADTCAECAVPEQAW